MIIAYIAHPVGAVNPVNDRDARAQVRINLEWIGMIARKINLDEPGVVPFVPYYLDCVVMDDNKPAERARGIANDAALLKAGFVNELRLYGTRISAGMWQEIKLAEAHGITIRPMTPETEAALYA